MIRQINLGYHSLAADLLFIRANLYYGHHLFTDEQMPWLSDFIDILIELDPDFKKIYLWGALVTTHHKRKISNVPSELLERAVVILEKGMQRFPNDYHFPMQIAYNYYYEYGDIDAALPYFELASQLPGSPDWLRKKLFDIYSKKGRDSLARLTLQHLIMETEDPSLTNALKSRLVHFMDEPERKELTACRQEIFSRWQNEFDYIPMDLFLVIGENTPELCSHLSYGAELE